MPALPSFIPLYNKSKPKWKPKFGKSTFSPHIGSPHPLPSPDLLDNTSSTSFGSIAVEAPAPGAEAGTIPARPARPPPTPRIRLDFDLSEEPLDAWFQTHFLNDNDAPLPLQNGAQRKSTLGAVFVERTDAHLTEEGWRDEDVDVDGSITEDDALLEHIRALDSTPFFGVAPPTTEEQNANSAGVSKRQPPSPIFIPTHSMRNQVQLVRHASDDPSSANQSRPISVLSDAESSAVSGRTLARALLANTFVLSSSSSDGRSSRYRSGTSGLVRTDSATLPRGEHPFLHCPHSRDRTLSATSDTNASDIPPIPANADKVYVPPQTLRNSGPDSSTLRRKNLRRHSSTGSLKTPDSNRSSKDSKTRSRPNSTIISASSLTDSSKGETMESVFREARGVVPLDPTDAMDKDIRAIRRISRISEATTISSPTTPANMDREASDEVPPPVPEKGVSPVQQVLTLPSSSPPLPPSTGENPESTEAPGQPPSPLLRTTVAQHSSHPERAASPETTPSPRELDTVLDYYSFIDTSPTPSSSSSTPEPIDLPHRSFAPPFSPIPEETVSQLSSPPGTSKSARGTPITSTSAVFGARSDLSPLQQRSPGQMFENYIFPSPPAQINQVLNAGPSMRATLSPVTRRTSRVVGGRNRTGNTPTPIKVDRDSKDLNAYKITVSPLPEGVLDTPSTASSGSSAEGNTGGGHMQQTFPESPNMFSPMWTAGSTSSMTGAMMQIWGGELSSLPVTPASAGLSYEQHQLLLTRAATSAQKRLTRQGSLHRAVSARALPKPQVQPTSPSTTAGTSGRGDRPTQERPNALQTIDEIPAGVKRISALSAFSSPSKYSDQSADFEFAFAGVPFQLESPTMTDDGHAGSDTHPYARPALMEGSSQPSSLQPSPRHAHSPRENNIHASTRSPSSQAVVPLHSSPATRPMPLIDSTSGLQQHQPTDHSTSNPTSILSTNQDIHFSSPPPPPPPVVITPPATDRNITSLQAAFSSHHMLSRISENSFSMESPPPYDTIDQEHSAPSSGGTNIDAYFTALANSTPPMHARNLSNEYLPSSRSILDGNVRDKRHRLRPMAPTGPRRPISSPHQPAVAGRNREASISSIASEATVTNRTSMAVVANSRDSVTFPPPPPTVSNTASNPLKNDSNAAPPAPPAAASVSPATPQFKLPPQQYRGMTMEQAKWTFTSAQLQNIVSRAIKQSAEASSIRLLRLETLDNEIPPELKRLEARKVDIIAKYRSLSRNSDALLSRLGQQLQHHANDMQTSIKLAGDLKEVTKQLQALAEELHYVDQQQLQIEILVERHHGSALSMALRKLNASFSKQMEQTQALQDRMSELEDENWTLRNDLNVLKNSQKNPDSRSQGHSQPQSPSQYYSAAEPSQAPSTATAELDQRKSTHSVAARRASQRYSRSTRLSTNRSLSQRSSMSSNARSSVIGGISSTNSTFVVPPVPPVPPMPRKRPNDISINTTNRSTIFSQVISSDNGTANTELRTMLRLQDELYHTLGISLRGGPRLRRSYSVLGLSEPQQQVAQPLATPNLYPSPSKSVALNHHTLPPSTSSATMTRPLSYPTSLLDAYNYMDKDRNDMLATLEMLSHDN